MEVVAKNITPAISKIILSTKNFAGILEWKAIILKKLGIKKLRSPASLTHPKLLCKLL